ncbi:hypothetical protein NECAME_05678 [Necator americanus]|uniref:ABC transmembrane type-1 domain-containing protein n=1 Tax=Necator americanus TaxID=51031 RepID=W2SHW0_NECAM|nr:hypothetical protein NECAME_05678 [Necator americanus]ETN68312.1 hypothetical protein NECAME_05678 [Necator americanus]
MRCRTCLPLLILLYLLLSFHYGLTCLFNFGPSGKKDALFEREIRNDYGVNVSELPYIAALIAINTSTHLEVQMMDLTGIFNVTAVIIANFAVIIFCGIRTYAALNRMQVRQRMKHIHTQLVNALLLQENFFFAETIEIVKFYCRYILTCIHV